MIITHIDAAVVVNVGAGKQITENGNMVDTGGVTKLVTGVPAITHCLAIAVAIQQMVYN